MTDGYTILVADDDPAIRDVLRELLRREGYRVKTAADGEEALRLLSAEKIHLVVMDVMMPRLSGLAATVRLREKSNVPVLILSAKAEGTDRVLGLDAGADDYLVKPFLPAELSARVKALLRRYDDFGSIRETGKSGALTVGDLTLNTEAKRLLVRGEPVRVTPTEYKILRLMMRNPGRVFSAEEIYSRVWDSDAYAVENTVMVHISRIREKIEFDPKKPEYLKVVWGIGYVFEAP